MIDDIAASGGQHGQQLELDPRDGEAASRDRRLAAPQVHPETVEAGLEHAGRRDPAPDGGVDSRDQLRHPDRLPDDIHRPGLQRGHDDGLVAEVGDHDDRRVRPGADAGDDRHAVGIGKARVQEDHVRPVLGQPGERRLAAVGGDHFVAGVSEGARDRPDIGRRGGRDEDAEAGRGGRDDHVGDHPTGETVMTACRRPRRSRPRRSRPHVETPAPATPRSPPGDSRRRARWWGAARPLPPAWREDGRGAA